MSEHKEFHLQVKRVAGIKVAGCEDCGGTSYKCTIEGLCHDCTTERDRLYCDDSEYCPTCAPWRELEKLCWHEDWALPEKPMTDDDAIVSLQKSQDWLSTVRAKLVHTEHAKDLDEIARHLSCKLHGLQIVNIPYSPNPIYTIQTIRAVLESLGEWKEFKSFMRRDGFNGEIIDDIIDTIASDSLMLDAAIEFLKGVE